MQNQILKKMRALGANVYGLVIVGIGGIVASRFAEDARSSDFFFGFSVVVVAYALNLTIYYSRTHSELKRFLDSQSEANDLL